ncbi:MAG: GNAT family N-acetyltransferase [Pseudaminobacter sp.]|nr:GNAT family N-acetyltransferase [Pseudaminobacter sp.]
MEGMEVRPATQQDEPEWRRLWTAYLAFYETTVPEEVYRTTWERLHSKGAFEPNCLLAVVKMRPVGLVHYLYHRSCWSLVDNCYLQDLFVDPSLRGTGLGRVLIEAVRHEAGKIGVSNVYWMTHETNATARKLYDRVARRTGFIEYDLLG